MPFNGQPNKLQDSGAIPKGAPLVPRSSSGILGDNTSRSSLLKLVESLGSVNAEAVKDCLLRASKSLNRGDAEDGAKWAIKALEVDENSGLAWHTLAICREMAGDFKSALLSYEAAWKLSPWDVDIINNLGRLSSRMGEDVMAEKFFRIYLEKLPKSAEAANNLGAVLRNQSRFEDAIEVLKAGIGENPNNANLWNCIGSVMGDIGDIENAFIFYDESLRLNPKYGKARYNRGNMRLAMGDAQGALQDCQKALSQTKDPAEICMMELAKAAIHLNLGNISAGWQSYEYRLRPQFSDVTLYHVGDTKQWKPNDDLQGKHLLVIAEQGLGDEILFGTMLNDVISKLGPNGKLTLGTEYRLVNLFQRSFPNARVGKHITYEVEAHDHRFLPFMDDDYSDIDLWTPIASLALEFRSKIELFPNQVGYLKPDPVRVAHWRAWLDSLSDRPKVGLLWKSAIISNGRHRYFSPFDRWEPILRTPGVTLVNLQYGDCSEELTRAREAFGVEIVQPPDVDLKQDLDEVAAICAAMDLVIGFSNATFNIGAAAGVASWLIQPPASWTALGTDHYPWYPQVKVFKPAEYNNWTPVMEEVAAELANFAVRPST